MVRKRSDNIIPQKSPIFLWFLREQWSKGKRSQKAESDEMEPEVKNPFQKVFIVAFYHFITNIKRFNINCLND